MANKNTELASMIIQRRVLGILCGLLAPCSLLFGLFGIKYNLPDWYKSISSTYYANSKLFMIGLLFATSIFFLSYKGYDWRDRVCSIIQSITCIGIVIFPCATPGIPDRVGLFCLTPYVSNIIHCTMASILFITFAFNITFLFTLGDGEPTDRKKLRNKIYYICGAVMFLFIINQAVYVKFDTFFFWHLPNWFPITWLNEFIMLESFGFAYIVKSRAIGRFNDIL